MVAAATNSPSPNKVGSVVVGEVWPEERAEVDVIVQIMVVVVLVAGQEPMDGVGL